MDQKENKNPSDGETQHQERLGGTKKHGKKGKNFGAKGPFTKNGKALGVWKGATLEGEQRGEPNMESTLKKTPKTRAPGGGNQLSKKGQTTAKN